MAEGIGLEPNPFAGASRLAGDPRPRLVYLLHKMEEDRGLEPQPRGTPWFSKPARRACPVDLPKKSKKKAPRVTRGLTINAYI